MLGQLLILQIVTFIILIVLLRFLFYRQLNSALERLKELHEENLAREAELKRELERAKKERVAEIEKGKKEAKKIIEETKRAGEILHRSIEEKAKLEAQKIIDQGKEELSRLKNSLYQEINEHAIELSLKMIKYTFTEKSRKSLHKQLIDELIDEIAKLEKERFFVKEDNVKVISSFPLETNEEIRLKEIISSKLERNIELNKEIDTDLIGGLVVEIGAFVIDGSLKNRLKRVIPYLREE